MGEFVRFFAYDPLLGSKEGTEHEKILFFAPSHVSLDDKTSHVGLCEALVNFTRTFSPDKPCETVLTDNHCQAALNPEGQYWMVLVGSRSIHESVLHGLLKELYGLFKLFNGSFSSIVSRFSVKTLKQKMEEFYPQQISNMKFDELGIDGIQFLPVAKNVYLNMVAFINNLEYSFSSIRFSAFMIHDFLVWSGLPQDEISILYKYVKRLNGGGAGYWTGPFDLSKDDSPMNIRHIWVNNQQLLLVIYKVEDALLLFVTDLAAANNMTFYRDLDKFIQRNISNIATVNRNSLVRPDEYRYVYFNHMNLAIKSSTRGIPKEYFKNILDMRKDFDFGNNEIAIQTHDNNWLVGRRTDQRELYFIFEKKATLLDVHDEVRNLSVQKSLCWHNLHEFLHVSQVLKLILCLYSETNLTMPLQKHLNF